MGIVQLRSGNTYRRFGEALLLSIVTEELYYCRNLLRNVVVTIFTLFAETCTVTK